MTAGNNGPEGASKAILERIASGDSASVDICLSRFGGLVWSLTKQYCGSGEDAEDLVQEIFIDLWQSAHRYDPSKSSESTFVAVIARRRLIDRLRKRSKVPAADDLNSIQAPSDEIGAETLAEQDEDARQARECLAKLKGEEKVVIEMTVCCGHSQAWVAEKLQLPLGTVKSHARRGLVKLRNCMRAAGFGVVPGGAR